MEKLQLETACIVLLIAKHHRIQVQKVALNTIIAGQVVLCRYGAALAKNSPSPKPISSFTICICSVDGI
jgi:hypothetical protein